MKDFNRLITESMKEVTHVGIKPGNITSWTINKRAKSRWGLCKQNPDKTFEIQIAEALLTDDRITEKSCKETIIHEILHTCKNCMKHTGQWKYYAEVMNQVYGYNIKRITTGMEKGNLIASDFLCFLSPGRDATYTLPDTLPLSISDSDGIKSNLYLLFQKTQYMNFHYK